MSYIPPLDTSNARPKLPRQLDAVEIRILGCLIEKQMTTPDIYPLTLNALESACNQKSNREPVMELEATAIQQGLDRLQEEKLVWKVIGGRAVRFDHNLDQLWHLARREKALIALLFLRGPQTGGELRGRSDRLETFASVAEVESVLDEMSQASEPLVAKLPRRPGQKEERWTHLAGEVAIETSFAGEGAQARDSQLATRNLQLGGEPLSARVQRLEEQVNALTAELSALKSRLGE